MLYCGTRFILGLLFSSTWTVFEIRESVHADEVLKIGKIKKKELQDERKFEKLVLQFTRSAYLKGGDGQRQLGHFVLFVTSGKYIWF